MKLIDTHAHLYASQFDEDRDAVVQTAIANGVTAMYLPNVDSDSIAGMLSLEAAYPAHCFAMMGLHPCSVNADYLKELAIVEQWLSNRSFCAIGEIGIDLYWDKTYVEEQKLAFLMQVEWAKALRLPIVIHSRESIDIIIALLKEVKDDRLKGIFHCFTGDFKQAMEIIDLGFYLGIGGVLTFPKAGLDAVVQQIDLQHLVLETDSPYLSPVPHRGKRNESAYLRFIAEKLAAIKAVPVAEVAQVTSDNAEKIFNWQNAPKILYSV